MLNPVARPEEVYAFFNRQLSSLSVFSAKSGQTFFIVLGAGYPTPADPLIRGYTRGTFSQLYEAELEGTNLVVRLPDQEVTIKFPSLEMYKKLFCTSAPMLIGVGDCIKFSGNKTSWKYMLSKVSSYVEEQYPVPQTLTGILVKKYQDDPSEIDKNRLYRWFYQRSDKTSILEVQTDFVDFCIHRFPALYPMLLAWKGVLMSKSQVHALDFGLESIQQSYKMSYPNHKIDGKTFAQSTSAIARAKPQAFLRHGQLSRMTATYGITKLPSSWGEFAKAAMNRKIHPGLARRDWMEYLETTRPRYASTIQKWRSRERKIYAQTFGRKS